MERHSRKNAKAKPSKLLPVAVLVLTTVVSLSGCLNSDPNPEQLLAKADKIKNSNPDKAIALTRLAADLGHVPALIALGNYESNGRLHPSLRVIINRDTTKALSPEASKWYAKARVELEKDTTANSRYFLAVMLKNGDGGPVDMDRAYKLAAQAAHQGQYGGLTLAIMWALKAEDDNRVDELLKFGREKSIPSVYQMESLVNSKRYPDDVLLMAQPLFEGTEAGVEQAEYRLKTMAYSLTIAAERTDSTAITAISSIRQLKEAGLWVEPGDDFLPNKSIGYATS